MFNKTVIRHLACVKIYAFLVILSVNVFNSVSAANIPVSCPQPKEANDILKCLQEKHPEVISPESIKNVAEKLAAQGSAWKNPSVSFETVGGANLGSSVYESELRISQAVEFSGQRGARRQKGRALGDLFQADSLGKIEEVTLLGVKSLYRLSQINDESSKIQESLQRFKMINNLYQSRLQLNPEQEITQGLIQLATSEFDFRLNQLNTEKNEILTDLIATTDLKIKDIEANLPSMKNALKAPPIIELNLKSAAVLKTQAEMNFSKAALEEAKAEAWPEFTVDIIAQNNIEGSLQYQMFGAGVSIPIPVFQRNEGEKSLKAVEFSRSYNIHSTNVKKQESVKQNLQYVYETSVKNMQNTPANASIEKKHKKAEQLFSQGLISGPLIIETHKQILEYTQIRNQEELKAIEALWRLHILKGDFLEQTI